MDKKSLGINGIHQRLGHEITEAEFRGYMIAKIEAHHATLLELKETLEKHMDDSREIHALHSQKISSLESSRAQATGFIAGIAAISGVVTAIVVAIVLHFLGI